MSNIEILCAVCKRPLEATTTLMAIQVRPCETCFQAAGLSTPKGESVDWSDIFSVRIRNVLSRAGIYTWEQLQGELDERAGLNLLKQRNFGMRSLDEIKRVCFARRRNP